MPTVKVIKLVINAALGDRDSGGVGQRTRAMGEGDRACGRDGPGGRVGSGGQRGGDGMGTSLAGRAWFSFQGGHGRARDPFRRTASI